MKNLSKINAAQYDLQGHLVEVGDVIYIGLEQYRITGWEAHHVSVQWLGGGDRVDGEKVVLSRDRKV